MTVILVIAIFVLILVALAALWVFVHEVLPKKIDDMLAKPEIHRFANSPAAQYASEKIIESFGDIILNSSRSITEKNIMISYRFSVSERGMSSGMSKQGYYDLEVKAWNYDFNQNRYPQLDSSSDRTALALAITEKVLPKLRESFPVDISGSTDVTFTYSKDLGLFSTEITLYYEATNACYEEFKSW